MMGKKDDTFEVSHSGGLGEVPSPFFFHHNLGSKKSRTYLKILFAPLSGLGGLNLSAENAEKRKARLSKEPPIAGALCSVEQMVSSQYSFSVRC